MFFDGEKVRHYGHPLKKFNCFVMGKTSPIQNTKLNGSKIKECHFGLQPLPLRLTILWLKE